MRQNTRGIGKQGKKGEVKGKPRKNCRDNLCLCFKLTAYELHLTQKPRSSSMLCWPHT